MDILTILIVGLIAGWIGSVIMKGRGLGLFGDIVVGILGAFIGGFIFSLFGIATGGLFGTILAAIIGSVVLLFIVSLFRGESSRGATRHN
jgi:uncharacterized membrane protein YeaQ/YmgE (transglycosylase-associated protein family)